MQQPADVMQLLWIKKMDRKHHFPVSYGNICFPMPWGMQNETMEKIFNWNVDDSVGEEVVWEFLVVFFLWMLASNSASQNLDI